MTTQIIEQKSNLDYDPIYKVNHILNGTIDTIYVFYGNNKITENENDLFKKLFTNEEIENINKNNINVKFLKQKIYFDDTIGVIKLKILNELKNSVSLGEIYLFCQKIEILNSISVYQSITQNKKIELTPVRLNQFISNIVSDIDGNKFIQPKPKDLYSFDDILDLKLENKKYIVNKVLGQKFFIVENEYPFVCNPYNLNNYDKLFEKSARKSLSTLNSHLLLNTGEILNNNIYLCLANEVLSYTNQKGLSEDTTLKVYYPFLYNKNINNIDELEERNQELIDENKNILTEKTLNSFNTIDMFYDIYKLKKTNLNYHKKGIQYIKVILKSDYDVKMPLDIIFKMLHATENNPFIKYNPTLRQENIYRLYADKVAQDGRKIPYLKKANIFKLMKNIGKTKSVSVFINPVEEDKNDNQIICEFMEEGMISISTEFNNIISISDIEKLYRDYVNPIILEVKNFLEQGGFKIGLFNSLYDENIEIKQLTYISQIYISKPIKFEPYKGCISSIFNDESNQYKEGIILRYKRVSNFNKVTSQEAFILEKQEQGYRGEEIIEALLDNYPNELNREQAIDLLKKIANEIQVERGVRKSDIKIKENPGFKTSISLDKQTSMITITVENINDINYLSVIPIYLDSMIRLTQDKNSTSYPSKDIDKICMKEQEDIVIPDIISPVESEISELEIPSIIDEDEVEYSKKDDSISSDYENKTKNALDLFFGDDEEFSENDYESSGGNNNDSGSSIESEKTSNSEKYKISSPNDSLPSLPSLISEKETSQKIISPQSIVSEESIASEKSEPTPESKEKIESKLSELKMPSLISEKETSQKLTLPQSIVSEESIASEKSEPTPESKEKIESKLSELKMSSLISEKETSKKITSPTSIISEKIEEKLPKNVKKSILIESDSISSKKSTEISNAKNKDNEKYDDKNKSDIDKSDIDENDMEESDKEGEENMIKKFDGIDGMSLRNYFQNRIEEHDAPLIVKQKIGNYSIYSKICQSHQRRQPVILTDKELDKINKNLKGFLRPEDIIKYGSDEKKQFNYICPRYWCLLTNTPIDPNELKETTENGKTVLSHPKCGKVLDEKDDVIKPGHYIYEFYKTTKTNPNYKRYPGFQTDKHPKGYCLPCCFDKYLTEGRVKANQKCTGKTAENKKNMVKDKINEEKKEVEKKEDTGKEDDDEKQDEYIKGPDKFPLQPKKWGYLPVSMQKMLHEVNADCQISKTNTNIKQNHPCLLRHGVEINQKQSFIACISDAIFFASKVLDENNKVTDKFAKILSISEMKERIIKSLTIDNFIKYQNGNLVTDFNDSNKEINFSNYTNSKLYKKIDMNNRTDKIFFQKVTSAYENFISYLKDNDSVIDYTYLWDIICSPNKYLFGTSGINLIIFEIPDDDITNNVRLICPSNHYSSIFYEARKPSLFLMKKDGFYEPIYSYTNSNNKITITKVFSEYDTQLSKTIRAVLKELVRPFLDSTCKPLPSMPNIYHAKNPILLYNLVQKLDKYEYDIIKLVLNYNSKVIGVVAKNPSGLKGFIPCYPASLNEHLKKDLDYVFMSEPSIWNTYKNTIEFLTKLEKRSKKKMKQAEIPCKPAFKIVEDEMVVGILTETNQFIQLSEPILESDIEVEYDIPSFKNNNYIVNKNARPMISSDIPITTSNEVDKERVDYIKKIKLESNFYNVFRNTIRILLNDYENVKIREKIENEITKQYIIYSEKLKNIDKLLNELVGDNVQFIGDDKYYKIIDEVSTCIVKDNTSCKKSPNICAITDNGKCKLILPEKNLITNKMNKPIYFGKMADELIRYNQIKSFMLQPQTYISFGNIGYNLRDNEIILTQSSLTQEYFDNLIPAIINKYVKFNSYDEVEPIISQTYDNVISSLDDAIGKQNKQECKKSIKKKISSAIWNKCFPSDFKEIEYNKLHYCTFSLIIDIIEKKTGEKMTINDIKNMLYEEYKKYIDKYFDKIIDILIIEGKKTLGDQVKSESLSFVSFIYTDNYFLTTFDLWLLINKFKIPTIFICQKYLLQTGYKKHSFVGYGDDSDKFIFIVIPGLRSENIPGYKIIENDKNEIFISLNEVINEDCKDMINDSIKNKITIENYLETFKKPTTTTYTKKKPLLIIDDSESEIEEKPKKKNLIIEETRPISEEHMVLPKKTKKNKYTVTVKRKTRKNIKKPNLLIIESSSSTK